MKFDPRPPLVLGALLLLFTLPPVSAQEAEEDEEDGPGKVSFHIETWSAKATGLDYSPASMTDSNNPFATRVLVPDHGTESEARYRFGYELPGDRGNLVATWFAHETLSSLSAEAPGQTPFPFRQSMTNPFVAGYQYDGLSDAFDSAFKTVLRDLRVDYYRTAFTSPKIWAEWFAGVRRVQHNRRAEALYYALVPNLPPLLQPFSNPRPDLDPRTDGAFMESKYNGRGIEAGLDFHMPMYKDRVRLDTGLAIAVMKGTVESTYTSTTHYYTVNLVGGGNELVPAPLADAWAAFELNQFGEIDPLVNRILQRDLQLGLVTEDIDTAGEVLEAYLAVQVRLYRGLSGFVGYRATYYGNVGVDLRSNSTTAAGGVAIDDAGNLIGVNFTDVSEIDRSATYEGVFVGLEWAF